MKTNINDNVQQQPMFFETSEKVYYSLQNLFVMFPKHFVGEILLQATFPDALMIIVIHHEHTSKGPEISDDVEISKLNK